MKKEIKEIEVIEAEPINVLETIKVSALIDVSSWKEKQLKLVAENPFFEITDNKTYEAGKKHRTNVVKGRTELQNQDKLVASKFATIRKEVGTETATLIEITQPLEDQWQEEVKAWEERKAKQKEEEEAAEALRVKTINDKIDETETSCYEIIQKMIFSEIDFAKTQLFAFFTVDFDFEEYDILFEQVKSRVETALENKVASLTVSENQRLDNIRLEEANVEAKRLADLQASRLTEIMPYVALGVAVDLTKLSELTKDEWEVIFSAKKALFDAHVLENKKIEDERIAREEEEKEAIYEIRKKRLEEAGMKYSDEHDTLWLEEADEYILLKEDISDCSALEFEETFSEVKTIVQNAKDIIEKQKVFDIRKDRLAEIGFVSTEENVFRHPILSTGIIQGYSIESISDADSVEFETIINDAKLDIYAAEKKLSVIAEREKALSEIGMVIQDFGINFKIGEDNFFTVEKYQIANSTDEQFENMLKLAKESFFKFRSSFIEMFGYKLNEENSMFEMEGFLPYPIENVLLPMTDFDYWLTTVKAQVDDVNEQLSIADAAKLKAENKARIKKYSADKKLLTEFVKSLEFRNAVPEFENESMHPLLDSILQELENVRGHLLTSINLF